MATKDEGIDITNQAEMQQAFGDDLFTDDSTKPASNWFKFEKVGDAVQGVLTMEPYDQEGDYGTQVVYPIQTAAGEEVNVGLKKLDMKGNLRLNVKQLQAAEIGDVIAFRFEKEVDTGKGHPAKSIEVRIRHMMK